MSVSQDPNYFLPGSTTSQYVDENGISNYFTIAEPSEIVLSNKFLENN